MKFVASLLICCTLILSAFGGRVKSAATKADDECCSNDDKHQCGKKANKPLAKECEKQGCNMMLTCSICGFLAVEPIAIQSSAITFIENLFPIYKSGNSTVYLPTDWKPPKV